MKRKMPTKSTPRALSGLLHIGHAGYHYPQGVFVYEGQPDDVEEVVDEPPCPRASLCSRLLYHSPYGDEAFADPQHIPFREQHRTVLTCALHHAQDIDENISNGGNAWRETPF
jgi:hypothetical protein